MPEQKFKAMTARELMEYLEDMLEEMPDLAELPLATDSALILTGIDTDGTSFMLDFA